MANPSDPFNTPVSTSPSRLRQTKEREDREFEKNHARHDRHIDRLDKGQPVSRGGRRGE